MRPLMCAMRPSPNGFWLSVCIAKVIGIFGHRVTSMPRLAFEGLEPCDGRLSRRVLRGLGGSNAPRLPGYDHIIIKEEKELKHEIILRY